MDCEQIESNNIAELYLMDKLEVFKKAQFEIHFISCQKCADLLFEIQDFREALQAAVPKSERGSPKAIIPRRARSWRMATFVAAAVAVIVLFASALLLRDNLRLQNQLSRAEGAPAPVPQPQPLPEQDANTNATQSNKESLADRGSDAFPSSPQINTPIIVLSAIRDTSASNSETNEIAIGASQWFVISVELENRQFDDYRATILTQDRRPFWKSGNLRPDRHDAITIGCTPGFFRAGDYLLILEGRPKRGSFSSVATYPFRVVKKK